jgi:SNF2 family DNA or RNA helicase
MHLSNVPALAIASTSKDKDSRKWAIKGAMPYAWFTSIPERTQSTNYAEWLVGATDTTYGLILSKIEESQIVFQDELARAQWDEIKLRTKLTESIREAVAVYAEHKLLPARADNLINVDERIASHQRMGAVCASVSPGFGLFMEQGTGKTLTAITAMSQLPKGSRVLIVCPKNVRMNWQHEFAKFCQVSYRVQVIKGTKQARISRLIDVIRNGSDDPHLKIGIIGYDSIPGSWEALQMIEWDLIVADESHYFKSHKTNRWDSMLKIRNMSKRRWCLTGTPIANSVNDLWTQFEFMGEGFSGFTTWNSFKKQYGVYDRSADGTYEAFLGLQNVDGIKDRLSRYSFTVTKKQALPDLPDKLYDIDEVEMSEEQQAAYTKLQTELAFEIDQEINREGANQALVVNNILTMLLKLAQITSGFLNIPPEKDEDGNVLKPGKTITFNPNPKIERLQEILQAKKSCDKTIIWACWIEDIRKIKLMCDMVGIKAVTFYGATTDDQRDAAVHAFNHDPHTKVFIGNPGAGGTGLNLLGYPPGEHADLYDTNANHTIYVSQDWSMLKRNQSEDRGHRTGTRVPMQITDLCVPETIDVQIRERVVEKRIAAHEIGDIKDLLRQVLSKE